MCFKEYGYVIISNFLENISKINHDKLFILRSLPKTEMNKKQDDLTGILKEFKIVLPRKAYSALSHEENIDYCIEQLGKYSGMIEKPVVGYFLERGLGNREAYYRILAQTNAEGLKRIDTRFDYFTLDDFLKEKAGITHGKYIMNKGLIVDFADSYSR